MKAQMHNYATWVPVAAPTALKSYFGSLLTGSGFTVLDVVERHFTPYGYTALFLLGESHFAIHTFPEHQQSYIELTSCIKGPFDIFINQINLSHVQDGTIKSQGN